MNVHKEVIKTLEDRLKSSGKYFEVFTNTEYGYVYDGRVVGEVDVGAVRHKKNKLGKYVLVFEVKSWDKEKYRLKAVKQMNRFYEFLRKHDMIQDYDRVFKFYVYGRRFDKYNNYSVNWVRDKKWLK